MERALELAEQSPVRSGLLMLWCGLLLRGLLPPSRLFSTQDDMQRPTFLGQRWAPYTAEPTDHWFLEGLPRGQGWDRQTRGLGAELAVLTSELQPAPGTVVRLTGTPGMLLCGRQVTLVLVRASGSEEPAQRQPAEVVC